MTRALRVVLLAALVVDASACASRGFVDRSSSLVPVADVYSRNPVVATPTLVGNVVGGFAGEVLQLVPYLFAGTLGLTHIGHTFPMAVAGVVGGIVGAPFVPLALIVPEFPWYFSFGRALTWDAPQYPTGVWSASSLPGPPASGSPSGTRVGTHE